MPKAKPRVPPVIQRCSCGAMPPIVGVIASRRATAGKRCFVGCTRCGRVGEPAGSDDGAVEHWNAGMIKYSGELEEVGG